MARKDKPIPMKGFALGLAGGLLGAVVMRWVQSEVTPQYFPPALPPANAGESPFPDVVENHALIRPQYQEGETAFDTAGRVFHQIINGEAPRSPAEGRAAADLLHFLYFTLVGGAYGGSRGTRRARDFSSTFFFGIRLWTAETFAGAALGFRAGPTRFSTMQHLRRLVEYWAYTAVAVNGTRLLYRLFSPEDWHDNSQPRP